MQVTQEQAVSRRESGIFRGEVGANAEIDGWSDLALERIVEYAASHETFLMEEVRRSLPEDFPEPSDARAWGVVTRKAVKDKIISRTENYAPARSSNLSPKPVWSSLIFKEASVPKIKM